MKRITDPGIGYSSNTKARGILNKEGSSNIIHLHKKFNFRDIFSYLIQISWGKFFVLVFLGYVIINIFFGVIYTIIGIEEITTLSGNTFKDFLNGFFFSAQTITTVGYGGIAPHGLLANIISSFEALIGLLSFSFITGLLYGRFSKPKASIKFSKNIIFRDFNGEKALMFRLMNNRTNMMIEPEISVTLSKAKKGEDKSVKREFYQLELEFDRIKFLPTTWTIVHKINKENPLYNLIDEEIKKVDLEWYILIQYYDESFSQKVYQVHSYSSEDLKFNVKFEASTSFNDEGFTVLDHSMLSELTPMDN